MKILVIGSGGREHALIWKIKQSPLVKKIFCAPGNGGIADLAECVPIAVNDIPALLKFAKDNKIDLTVVGPEAPLVAGIVDIFEKEGLKIFGPKKLAAQLEGSKAFAKDFMHNCNIPTAIYRTFENIEKAKVFIRHAEFPLVIKADGLASGKGVLICQNRDEANDGLDQIMKEKVFKEAGNKVVIEEFLEGEEASILAISDGRDYVVMEASQDHKRIFDEDMGPNTGGMGAYCPAPVVTDALMKKIETRIIDPVIRGMSREVVPFKGVLYAGIMITKDGPKVLEFNVRFGDPETEAVLPRLKTDLVEVMLASVNGRISEVDLAWERKSCVSVIMSSGGYPGKFEIGKEIVGLDKVKKLDDTFVFHAGTEEKNSKIVTSGGRVLAVTALGKNIEDAIAKAYKAVEEIHFDHCFFRRDIAAKAIKKRQGHNVATSQG